MNILRENKTVLVKNIALDENIYRPDLKGKYGLAVDIGTTTVAAGLFELSDGHCVNSVSERNRQCSMGKDVIMRVMHAINGKLNELHKMIISQIEDIAVRLCEDVCETADLYEICVVGNTAMCHLFLGKSVKGLAGAPFSPSYKGNVSCKGSDCGFKVFLDVKIYLLSGVAAHVGADAVSFFCFGVNAVENKNILAIDIGTNAEIILKCQGTAYVCSAAAGPAFEGMGISCGLPACGGAISGVKIIRGSGNIILDIIHEHDLGVKDVNYNKNASHTNIPKGICGSGLVDFIAELGKNGFLDENGYLLGREDIEGVSIYRKFCDNLVERDGEHSFLLCQASDLSKEIYLRQSDIRNFQMAKAAIQAGANCLLRKAGIGIDDLDEVVISGMFGSYIPKDSAVLVGLFPDVPFDKIRLSGNLAGTGAAKALLDEKFREETEKWAIKLRHVELADNEEFGEEFVKSMQLKRWHDYTVFE